MGARRRETKKASRKENPPHRIRDRAPVIPLPFATRNRASRILERQKLQRQIAKNVIEQGRLSKGKSFDRQVLQFQKDFLGRVLPKASLETKRIPKPLNARRLAGRFTGKDRFSQEEAPLFAKRSTAASRRRVLYRTDDVRAIGIKRNRRTGEEIQHVFDLSILILTDVLNKDYTSEDMVNPNTTFTAISDEVNQRFRRQLTEMFLAKKQLPAYVQFTLAGLTPGTHQTPRKLIVFRGEPWRRYDLDPDVQKNESLQAFLERAMLLGMQQLRASVLRVFTKSDLGPFTVLKVTSEVGFAKEARGRKLYRFLTREKSTGHLGKIEGGRAKLDELKRRYGP